MFEPVKNTSDVRVHERNCIMLYGFSTTEEKQIITTARMVGITDCIILKSYHLESTIKEILDNEVSQGNSKPILEKAVLFNTPVARMNLMIGTIKKFRMKKPLYAIVTKNALNWTLKEWLNQLVGEREAMQKGTQMHEYE